MKNAILTIFFILVALATCASGAELLVPSQYPTIQSAIDDCNNGDVVIIAPGTYTGEGNRAIDFLGKAITVRSESGPDNCIIDCQGTEAEPHRGFYFHRLEGPSSILNGLTIINGHAPLMQYQPYDSHTYNYWAGGAIFCYQSSPTISNCHLIGNYAYWYGGAISGWKSDAIITGCTITNNVANGGGGANCREGKMIISNCIISNNIAISSSFTSVAGGIFCESSANAIINNCVITGNIASVGGGIYIGGFCSPVITNCTFSGNTATTAGGAIFCGGSGIPFVVNSVLWGDSATNGTEIAMSTIDWGSSLSISYSNIQGGKAAVDGGSSSRTRLNWGTGNIDADPCFIQPGYWIDSNDLNIIVEPNDPNAVWLDGDYHLLPGSLCINAGDPNYVPEPNETDLDGNPRIDGGRIDMGAYESIMHKARLQLWPCVINRRSPRPKWITAWVYLPVGITKDQVDEDTPLTLYPFGIKAARQFVFQNRRRLGRCTRVLAFFERNQFLDAIDTNGRVQLMVHGYLSEPGRFFFGSDFIRITPPPTKRPWWWCRHY